MNNIYKVIWSKAKNCYVVASEIARSHTKSATGSEKIGGVTRRSLLASLMALSLLCGGLGVASAVDGTVDVEDIEATTTSKQVYTADKVDNLLKEYGKKTDVDNNKNNITTLQNTTTDQGKQITENTTNIANNKDAIAKKIDTETANERFAAKVDLTALQNQVTGKVDENTFEDALGDKADKTYVDTEVGKKADKTYVDTEVGKKADKATTLAGYDINDAYTKDATDTAITTKVNEEKNARELKDTELSGRIDTLSTTVDSKVSKNDLNTTLGNYYTQAQTNAAIKTAVDDEKNARENAINGEVTNRTKAIADAIAREETNRNAAITNAKIELQEKVTAEETKRKEEDAKLEGKITENTTAINNEKAVREAADTDLSKRIGTVTEDGKYIKKSGTNNVSENLVELDKQAKTNADNIQTNANNIKNNKDEIARVNGELVKTNNYFNTELSKTNNYFNTELSKTNNHFNTELGKTNTALQATNKRTAGIGRTDTGVEAGNQTVIEDKVYFDQNGNVSGVKDLQTDTIHATGEITTKGKVSAGDISTGTLETTGKATIGGNLDVTGTLNIKDVTAETINISKSENTTEYQSKGSIIGDGGKLSVSNEKFDKRNNITEKSELNVNEKGTVNWATSTDATGNVTVGRSEVTADNIKNSVKKTEGGKTFGYEENITADGKAGTVTDKAGNTTYTKVTATENSFQVQDKDGKNKNHQVNTKDSSVTEITNGDGKTTKTEQTATDITNTAKDGTITNDANHIVNNANTMDTTVTGKATESYGELDTTVNGQATENFNGGLNTKVTGAENHTVTGKQTNTVGGGQENIISGGQINNITGDQTTTVTGKVTENYKAGQATNVTGDQDITVSGSQTTTATDINRNASSGMIDTIDNDYGTNTETKVAGKTTTDVSIKGTGEKGQYIRGATESRDYLIKDTLKNSETKTAEATSTEITDGTNKASTRQDAKNLAGSVTNGTETGVSGIHANDDGSVSIDSAVAGGGMSSVINQKKDSIQSAVGDGTNSTVIRQDKDNVTIASSKGMVAIGGKDILNNAQDTITNTAGTKITDTAGDSTVTTENGKGTTFTKTGSTAYREGGPTDTNISGNTITTGKVTMDYAQVMRDLGVNGNANIDGKTTTGSLEVKGESKLTGKVTMESDATVGGKLDVTGKATFQNDVDITGNVTAKSYKVGEKTYIDENGIHANGQKITDVADGSISEGSKDAVNGGQLYNVKNDLEGKVNKVGANAAAMANLHPMEFDPDSKWNIAAAIGNYGSETAAALGAFYRPNDDVMVNLSTAFGTGENMVGGGVSVRLGKGGNKLSREESNALKDQVNDLTARMDALLSVLNPNMSKDFPDVPENHWAYEAVSRLAGNDIVQGYPDGEFHGDRTMTRYEMAEIIYNALSRGAEAEKELVEEFKPELQAMAASEKATAERAEG